MAAHSSAARSTSSSSETSCRTTLQSCSRLCLLSLYIYTAELQQAVLTATACAYCLLRLCLLPTAAVLTLATLTMAVLTGAVLIVAVFSMAILTTGQRGAV